MTDDLRIIIEPAGLTITPDSYRTRHQHRDIADRIMATYGYNPDQVIEARLTEGAVEIDTIDRHTGEIHTDRHTLGTSRGEAPESAQ